MSDATPKLRLIPGPPRDLEAGDLVLTVMSRTGRVVRVNTDVREADVERLDDRELACFRAAMADAVRAQGAGAVDLCKVSPTAAADESQTKNATFSMKFVFFADDYTFPPEGNRPPTPPSQFRVFTRESWRPAVGRFCQRSTPPPPSSKGTAMTDPTKPTAWPFRRPSREPQLPE